MANKHKVNKLIELFKNSNNKCKAHIVRLLGIKIIHGFDGMYEILIKKDDDVLDLLIEEIEIFK